ncbi:MAG: hypothetical protein LBU82_08535 [Treponema sp.]|nr:hypothetical protein [Treponema sp.]
MKTFIMAGFFTLALLFSQNLTAQENIQENINLVNFFNAELFQWSYDFWGGLNLNYQNQSSKTMFGLKDSMQKALAEYNDTNQKFLSYKKKTLFGHIFLWSGYAAVLSSPFILAFSPMEGDNYSQAILNATYGVLGGGLASVIAGAFLFTSGQENIFDAVNLYNRNKLAEYKNW